MIHWARDLNLNRIEDYTGKQGGLFAAPFAKPTLGGNWDIASLETSNYNTHIEWMGSEKKKTLASIVI